MKEIFIFIILFFSYFFSNAQNKNLRNEIIDAIEFAETDTSTVSISKKLPNQKFFRNDVKIYPVFIIGYNFFTKKVNLIKNKNINIAFFPKNGSYKIYASDNSKKLINPVFGRVGSYPLKGDFSKLYNKIFKKFEDNDLLNSSLSFCYFSDNNKLSNTMKPILINTEKNKFITNQLSIVNNIEFAITNYFGSLDRFIQEKKDEAIKNKYKIESLKDAVKVIKNNYTNYIKHHPQDTIKNLNIFLKELDNVTGELNVSERRLLTDKILKRINYFPKTSSGSFGIFFYNVDISEILLSVLTRERFNKYLAYNLMHKTINNKAKRYFIYQFRRLKKNGDIENKYHDINSYIKDILYN